MSPLGPSRCGETSLTKVTLPGEVFAHSHSGHRRIAQVSVGGVFVLHIAIPFSASSANGFITREECHCNKTTRHASWQEDCRRDTRNFLTEFTSSIPVCMRKWVRNGVADRCLLMPGVDERLLRRLPRQLALAILIEDFPSQLLHQDQCRCSM